MALPTSFSDLDKKELYRSAIEDFAVDVKETDTPKVINAALLEAGVTWNMYVEQHPEVKPKAAEPAAVTPPVSSEAIVAAPAEPVAEPVVRTQEPAVMSPSDLYLVKMNRENPLFEFRGYRFTKANPFVVMPAEATNALLTEEDGFAIATPAEAQEYYG